MAGKRKCPVCGDMVSDGKGFGGHMSKHSNKKRRGRKAAQTAVQSPKSRTRSNGRRIARSTASRPSGRAGGNLPPPPARRGALASQSAALFRQVRASIAQKLSQAKELKKIAERLEQLL